MIIAHWQTRKVAARKYELPLLRDKNRLERYEMKVRTNDEGVSSL